MKLHHALVAASAVMLLAACSSSSDPEVNTVTPASNDVPVTATASSMAYTKYAASLTNSETLRPVDLTTVTKAPTSETELPLAL